ncbi:MAG: hypothetical protein IT438_00775 [Phycisphaerales bacterium]|nr:hypothetical protein [Phycisphaerales bacterium]
MNTTREGRLLHRIGSAMLTAVSAAVLLLGGCSDSPWKKTYTPSDEAIGRAGYHGPVKVREVPWERVQDTLNELHAEVVASDVPEEDWPDGRKAQRHARLLKGLQVTADPSTVDVLGRSEFRSTDSIRPGDGKLEEIARSVGANTVVWSSLYMGQADVIRSEPVTEFRSGSYSPRGAGPSRSYSETSTIYVPVYIKADERAWIAYFLFERGVEQTRK